MGNFLLKTGKKIYFEWQVEYGTEEKKNAFDFYYEIGRS